MIDQELEQELRALAEEGLKTNPLRLEYEAQVHGLAALGEALSAQGEDEEAIARTLHEKRRALGKQFKEAAPPLFQEYIYAATANKYGDPLGPTYEQLRERKTPGEIIASASRPIRDLDDRLTVEGFLAWYRGGRG